MIWQVVVASLWGSSVLLYLRNRLQITSAFSLLAWRQIIMSWCCFIHFSLGSVILSMFNRQHYTFHVRRWVIMFSGSIHALCTNKLFSHFRWPWCTISGLPLRYNDKSVLSVRGIKIFMHSSSPSCWVKLNAYAVGWVGIDGMQQLQLRPAVERI